MTALVSGTRRMPFVGLAHCSGAAKDTQLIGVMAACDIKDAVEVPVQVNGRVRARIMVSQGASDDLVRRAALEEPKIQELTAGREIVKVVVVANRLVSVVLK